jgi:hypothetical protein
LCAYTERDDGCCENESQAFETFHFF